MKKNKTILTLTALMTLGLLTGCSNSNKSSNPSSGGGNNDNPPEENITFKIMVTAPTGVTYTIDKTTAAKDEEVTLTITGVGEGYAISEVTLNSNKTLTSSDDKTYTFKMPNQSAAVAISVAVTGEVVINGDFAVKLTKNATTGIYEAKGVKVTNGSKASARFYYQVGDTKLGCLDLDETISFGDIQICYENDYALTVATNCTYDFYYDPSKANDEPCYIQRVGVDVLPTTVSELSSLLLTSPTVRYEHAMYTGDLVSIHYEMINKDGDTAQDTIRQNYDWKKYKNNVSLGTAYNTDDDETMYVYRAYDEDKELYTVVDNYRKYEGSLIANDDPYRESYNNNEYYSAKYEIIEGDDYDYQRFYRNLRHTLRDVNTSAHMPGYYVEREFMYAYRVGFTADELTYSNINIVPTQNNDGTFSIAVDTIAEYDSYEGTYTSDIHQGNVFDLDLTFDARGALTSVNYTKTVYSKDLWNFTKHAANTGAKGNKVINLKATYTYGEASEECTFDTTPYFIKSFDKLQFINSSLDLTNAQKNSGKSYLKLSDYLYILDTDAVENTAMVSCEFSPSTALDLWQYAPTSSSNEDILIKGASDTYNQMHTEGLGDVQVTFTNHLTGSGAGTSKTIDVNVSATQGVWYFYIYGDYSGNYAEIETASSANVKAGGVYKYKLGAFRSDAPCVYHAVSDNSILKVTSADNSKELVIDVTGATKITETVKVSVTMESDYYDTDFKPTVLTFYVLPMDLNPVGNWTAVDTANYPNTTMKFTTEAYEEVVGAYKGVVVDEYYEGGESQGIDTYYFYYTYANGTLKATIYAIDVTYQANLSEEGYGVSDFVIDFYYEASTGYYGLYIGIYVYDSDYEEYYYDFDAIGSASEADSYTAIGTYVAFKKDKTN